MRGITNHQLEVMTTLAAIEASSGNLSDFDQLLNKLSWMPSKESAQFTIRAMISKGFIEKSGLESRRGRNRICYRITESGKRVLDPRISISEKPEDEAKSFIPGCLETKEILVDFLHSGTSISL